MGKAKLNIPMCAALVLLLLTMISIHMTSGLYARYTSTASSDDSARAAKFHVASTLEQAKDSDGNDVNGQFVLTVTNHSEVAVRYRIEIVTDAPLKATIGETELTATDGKMTFTDGAWVLAPGAESVEHTLELDVSSWVGVTSETTEYAETEPVELSFDVNVHAEQID